MQSTIGYWVTEFETGRTLTRTKTVEYFNRGFGVAIYDDCEGVKMWLWPLECRKQRSTKTLLIAVQ